MPRFAAIDVGSNALRLRIVEATASSRAASGRAPSRPPNQAPSAPPPTSLVAEASGASGALPAPWREIENRRASVRLGSEVFVSGRLTPTSIGQACAALRDFREAMDGHQVDAYRATATSAVREAENGATLVERARREAGIELEVIEGIEEARLIQLAVLRRLGLKDRTALLVDVGGGSTEVTLLEGGENTFSMSLPLGTVRLLETFLKGARTLTHEHERLLEEAVDRALAEVQPHLEGRAFDLVIGTGGNVDTLAELCPLAGGMAGFPRVIDVAGGRALFHKMGRMTNAERRDAFGLRPDRADTILPASAIFLRIAELFGAPGIVAPGVGLKEGILEEVVDKYFHVWDTAGEAESVLSACVRLGRRYAFDEGHGVLVASLAARLFDDLQPIHAFRERDRLLLRAAAILHDVGDFVRYDGHHKHSYYLIQHSDIMGLSADERAIVANLARYHRKGAPDLAHPNFRELDREARGKVRGLAAILRVADALDREHRGKVTALRGVVDRVKNVLTLFLEGEAERELEEWTVRAKGELMREVFDLDVVVAGAKG